MPTERREHIIEFRHWLACSDRFLDGERRSLPIVDRQECSRRRYRVAWIAGSLEQRQRQLCARLRRAALNCFLCHAPRVFDGYVIQYLLRDCGSFTKPPAFQQNANQ